jgi:hypothetical protein
VVIAARFVNDHDLATECRVALLDDQRVLIRRHYPVSVAADLDQCDLQSTTRRALPRPLELKFN